MRKLRRLIERNERWFMLGLLIVILVIFTVTDQITAALSGRGGEGHLDPKTVAGSFDLLPGERVEVTWEQYEQARSKYAIWHGLFSGDRQSRIRPSEVWREILLSAAAAHEGITVSNRELVTFLKAAIPPQIFGDRETYARLIREQFGGIGLAQFEEAVRAHLVTERVRMLYVDAFKLAPPASREEMVKQYTSQNIEFTRVSWGALDAALYLGKAEDELKADADPDRALRAFFESDPAVKADTQFRFRHPRRWAFEVLYTIHRNLLTDEAFQRLRSLVMRAFPEIGPERYESTKAEEDEYFGFYTDRILEQAGTSLATISVPPPPEEPRPPGEEPGDGEGEKKEGEKKEGEAKEGGEVEVKPPGGPDAAVLADYYARTRYARGLEMTREQIKREIATRKMFEAMHEVARTDEKKSLRELYDRLKNVDDPERPVCATEPNPAPAAGESPPPGGPLVIFRVFEKPLSGEEIEDLADTGIRFTHNVRARIVGTGDKEFPKLGSKADVLGTAGNGRMIWRVLSVEQERRKTFTELTDGEKESLRTDFYLPERARARAKEALEGVRKQAEESGMSGEALRATLEAMGARYFENEAITASYDPQEEPDRKRYWPAEFLHMRDRYFLRGSLARILGSDRSKNEIKPGSFLEVQVDSARTDAKDPGAAYLVLLLDRQRPTAESMPLAEFDRFVFVEAKRREAEDQRRWEENLVQLHRDFNMEFRGEMKTQIENEISQRAEAEKRR